MVTQALQSEAERFMGAVRLTDGLVAGTNKALPTSRQVPSSLFGFEPPPLIYYVLPLVYKFNFAQWTLLSYSSLSAPVSVFL